MTVPIFGGRKRQMKPVGKQIDYYEKYCSKCENKNVDEHDFPCKKCIDMFFDDWKNPKRKFGKYFERG